VNSLAAEERRNWLLEYLRASKTITLTDAADALGVSEMTVRRDLNSLEPVASAVVLSTADRFAFKAGSGPTRRRSNGSPKSCCPLFQITV
jgi:predicted ArsR family transcriptional regulator